MADVWITLKLMPESPEVDLTEVRKSAETEVTSFGGKVHKSEEEPIAFGLKALKITFIMNEDKGGVDPLEETIRGITGVKSCETIDVRRAIG